MCEGLNRERNLAMQKAGRRTFQREDIRFRGMGIVLGSSHMVVPVCWPVGVKGSGEVRAGRDFIADPRGQRCSRDLTLGSA